MVEIKGIDDSFPIVYPPFTVFIPCDWSGIVAEGRTRRRLGLEEVKGAPWGEFGVISIYIGASVFVLISFFLLIVGAWMIVSSLTSMISL